MPYKHSQSETNRDFYTKPIQHSRMLDSYGNTKLHHPREKRGTIRKGLMAIALVIMIEALIIIVSH